MGWVWMISTIVSLLTWLGVILLHIQFPNGFTVQNWLPGRISQDVLTFQISESSWVLAVIWLSLLVCVIAVSSANLENENSVLILSGSFAMAAVTLLSIESMSLLGLLITWTLIDMV
jgi:amino acid permease